MALLVDTGERFGTVIAGVSTKRTLRTDTDALHDPAAEAFDDDEQEQKRDGR